MTIAPGDRIDVVIDGVPSTLLVVERPRGVVTISADQAAELLQETDLVRRGECYARMLGLPRS